MPANRPNCRRNDCITGSSFLPSFCPAIENMTTKNDIRMVIMSAYDTIHSGAPSLGCSSAGADMVSGQWAEFNGQSILECGNLLPLWRPLSGPKSGDES